MLHRFDTAEFHGIQLVRDVFIETGTYRGESLSYACGMGYKELHSCDIVPAYVENARRMFAEDARVHIHLGSSPEVLQRIIDPHRATTLWLDAHFQATNPEEVNEDYGECPLMAELKVIFGFKWHIWPCVLIDDSRMFDHVDRQQWGQRFRLSHWPVTSEIFAALPSGYSMHDFNEAFWCLPSASPVIDS